MVDTFRGKLRVRKWPDKRGTPKSPNVRAQNDWFRDANELAKRCASQQITQAMIYTRNSGLYPRDLLLRCMAGNLVERLNSNGYSRTKVTKRLEPMTFQGAILNLASTVALVANVDKTIIWPLPVFDPFGFWDVSTPTRLTIPANVSMVEIKSGTRTTSGSATQLRTRIFKNGTVVSGVESGNNFTTGCFCSTGPIPVVPGDYFELHVISTVNGDLNDGPLSNFSATILTAV